MISQQKLDMSNVLTTPVHPQLSTKNMAELTLAGLSLQESEAAQDISSNKTNSRENHASLLLIPELLEIVLVSLPPLEVLTTCRTVCRFWRDLIDTSPIIRFSTWRAGSVPGRQAPRVTPRTYTRNPLALEILSNFWVRLNTTGDDALEGGGGAENTASTSTPKKKSKKNKDPPPPIDSDSFLARYQKICGSLIFSNSPPLDITIRITVQKYASKHIIARSYRSITTDIGIGWITDLDVLLNLMDEIVKLKNEGVYLPGKRNTMQAEIGWCVFLYADGEENGKRRECEVVERVDFSCIEPWGVDIAQVGRVREVSSN